MALALLALARHALQRALLDVLEVLVFDDREEAEGGDGDERVLVVDLRDVRRPLVVEVAPLLLDPRDHRRLVHCGELAVVAHLFHRAHLLEEDRVADEARLEGARDVGRRLHHVLEVVLGVLLLLLAQLLLVLHRRVHL